MNTNELFLNANKLPEKLSKKEVYELLEKIKTGDKKAKEKLVNHNIKLVLYEVNKKFSKINYDKKDLVSIGNIGLMKAINSFDTSKDIEFASYAVKCIDNEILMFLRKLKKGKRVDSLDKTISYGDDDNYDEYDNYNQYKNELTLKETIIDDKDFVENYIDSETYSKLKELVEKLPDRDKEIIKLHFGFYEGKIYKEREIASMFSISRSYVSKIITKDIEKLRKQLNEDDIIELGIEQTLKKNEQLKKEGENKMGRKLQTIYEYFSSYTKEEIDAVLEKLTLEEKELIKLRYGSDLNNPISTKLSQQEKNKFYTSLFPKIKGLLANPNGEIKPKKQAIRAIKNEIIETNQILEQNEQIKEESPNEIIPVVGEIIENRDENINSDIITKEDYLKMLELLSSPSFSKIISSYSTKDAMIISLKLGLIDGKCFSNSAISEFLGIEKEEVIEITKKVLKGYKEMINQIIDSTIKIVTEEESFDSINKTFHK